MGWLFGDSSSFDTSKSMRCFNNELYGKCGGCDYMNPRNYTSGLFSGYSYKCVNKGGYYHWDERACYNVSYVDPERVDCCERYKDFTGRKYFILTAICEILGIDENNRLFQEIKTLIDLVRSDDETTREAISYDEFGPDIADKLRNDEERVNICEFLLKEYLIKIYSFIGLNNTSAAIEVYKNMVMYLYVRYRNMDNYRELINAKQFENPKVLLMK